LDFTLGIYIYQLTLAKLDTEIHLNEYFEYETLIKRENTQLRMGKIQSRHVSKNVYKLWIEYDEVLVEGWYS